MIVRFTSAAEKFCFQFVLGIEEHKQAPPAHGQPQFHMSFRGGGHANPATSSTGPELECQQPFEIVVVSFRANLVSAMEGSWF